MDIESETIFLKELEKKKCVILTKENTRSARDRKRDAWLAIQEALVSSCGKEYSVQQLCKKWNNLQQRVKEKVRNQGSERSNKALHDRDMLCLQIIGLENITPDTNSVEYSSQVKEDPGIEDCPVVVKMTPLPTDTEKDEGSEGAVTHDDVISSDILNTDSHILDLLTSLACFHDNKDTSGINQNMQDSVLSELASKLSPINVDLGIETHDILRGSCMNSTEGGDEMREGDMTRKKKKREWSGGKETRKRKREAPHCVTHDEYATHGDTVTPDTPLADDTLNVTEDEHMIKCRELQRHILQLKVERLRLKNEKTKLQIQKLRGKVESRSCQTEFMNGTDTIIEDDI